MDTTYAGNALRSRAITEPTLWRLGYLLIIAVELITGACYLAASVQMLRRLRAGASLFNAAKRMFHNDGGHFCEREGCRLMILGA